MGLVAVAAGTDPGKCDGIWTGVKGEPKSVGCGGDGGMILAMILLIDGWIEALSAKDE